MAKRIKILQKAQNLWRKLRRGPDITVVRIEAMSELPDQLLKQKLYVVGGASPKWAMLSCPCGCGERIDVNLMQNRKPFWRLTVRKERATLYPSLWMARGTCRSHFWVKDGRIDWARSVSFSSSLEVDDFGR